MQYETDDTPTLVLPKQQGQEGDNALEPTPKRSKMPFWKVLVVTVALSLAGAGAVSYIVAQNTVNVEEIVEENNYVGKDTDEVVQSLQGEGLDKTMYSIRINDPENVSSGDYIVDKVTTAQDHIYITAIPTAVDVIENMVIMNENWHVMKQELSSQGYEAGYDYEVYTDSGTIYRDENWTVVGIDTDTDKAKIYLTNHVKSDIQDFGNEVTEGISEAWQNFRQQNENQ